MVVEKAILELPSKWLLFSNTVISYEIQTDLLVTVHKVKEQCIPEIWWGLMINTMVLVKIYR
jgi:hypothetical protein